LEAVAALVPSLGVIASADLFDRAADPRRRAAGHDNGIARPRPEPPQNGEAGDDIVLLGELLSAGRSGQSGTGAGRDSLLPGTPTLRNALANGGLVDGNKVVQRYEEQRLAGYAQELRQSTVIDLYV